MKTLETEISENTILFTEKNSFFSIRNITYDFSVKLIAFNGCITPMYTQYFDFESAMIFKHSKSEIIDRFNSVYDLCSSNSERKTSPMVELLLYSLIGICGEEFMLYNRKIKTGDEMLIDACNEYIKDNIDNINLDVNLSADLFQTTKQALNVLYQSFYGMDTNEYIYRYRMEFAKTLIIQQYDNYRNDCGYTDKHKFYDDFKKYCGKTPSDYLRILCVDVT